MCWKFNKATPKPMTPIFSRFHRFFFVVQHCNLIQLWPKLFIWKSTLSQNRSDSDHILCICVPQTPAKLWIFFEEINFQNKITKMNMKRSETNTKIDLHKFPIHFKRERDYSPNFISNVISCCVHKLTESIFNVWHYFQLLKQPFDDIV